MIRYDYTCQNCDHEIRDVEQSIKDKPKKVCPSCGKRKLKRLLYGGLGVSVKSGTSIGQLADKNAKDMGNYERSELEERAKAKKPTHDDGTATRKEIINMTHKQKQRYIREGNK